MEEKGTAIYQQLPGDCHAGLKACEPHRERLTEYEMKFNTYKTWNETK